MKIMIGILGFGCVGQGFYQTLLDNNLPVEVKKVIVKNPSKERGIPGELIGFEPSIILEDPDISLIVEMIDDADAALELVTRAMKNGKSVITANKKMVAHHLGELHRLAQNHNVSLYYEGAVCGAIPVIQNLDQYFSSESITRVEGIVNGSTNYILSKVLEENMTYDEALVEAQEKGFAESDPSLDVDGHDPSYKLKILVWHAFGLDIPVDRIFRRGIRQIRKQDVAFARENGWKIKLIAIANCENEQFNALIAPHFVASTHALYHINDEFNCIQFEGRYSGIQSLTGKGAGSLPTGLAVLSDLQSYLRGPQVVARRTIRTTASHDVLYRIYLGYEDASEVPFDIFHRIEEHFTGQKSQGYAVGWATLADLLPLTHNDAIRIILLADQMNVQDRLVKQLAPLSC